MNMIDPIAALLNMFLDDQALVVATGGQIAGEHKYALDDGARAAEGDYWPAGTQGLAITASPAPRDRSNHDHEVLVGAATAWCFAGSPEDAQAVWNEVDRVLRLYQKRVVNTPAGRALIYYALLDGSPQQGFDEALDLHYLSSAMRYRIYKYALED